MLVGCGMSKISRVKKDMENPNRPAKRKDKHHGTLPKNKIWRESRHAKLTGI